MRATLIRRVAAGTSAGLLTVLALGPAAGAGVDRSCATEVKAAGLWGRTINPGNTTFMIGSPADDEVPHVPADAVFCGFGGDDRVGTNEGYVFAGEGMDTVFRNDGYVEGGTQTDVVIENHGTFYGGSDVARDGVHYNYGFFDGGYGYDFVQELNEGTLVSVEDYDAPDSPA